MTFIVEIKPRKEKKLSDIRQLMKPEKRYHLPVQRERRALSRSAPLSGKSHER